MNFISQLSYFEEIEKIIALKQEMSLFYFTGKNCGVCSVVKPQVDALLGRHPEMKGYHVSIDEDPMISGQLSVYTVPMILIFYQGRELLREGKFIVISQLEPQIERIMSNFDL